MNFYELTIRYIDGRETIRFDEADRSEMIELLNYAAKRWDIAYIHVTKRDENGVLLNQTIVEAAGYQDFLDNC